jgi:hypothetical protein
MSLAALLLLTQTGSAKVKIGPSPATQGTVSVKEWLSTMPRESKTT